MLKPLKSISANSHLMELALEICSYDRHRLVWLSEVEMRGFSRSQANVVKNVPVSAQSYDRIAFDLDTFRTTHRIMMTVHPARHHPPPIPAPTRTKILSRSSLSEFSPSARPLLQPTERPKSPPVTGIEWLSRSLPPSGRPQWRWTLGWT